MTFSRYIPYRKRHVIQRLDREGIERGLVPRAETSVCVYLCVTATVVSRLTRDCGNMLINEWFTLTCHSFQAFSQPRS